VADLTTVKLRIVGRVQGVGYRAWAVRTAQAMALTGWVRNLADGSVEALAHGPTTDVEQFIAACRDGPVFAKVTNVETRHVNHDDVKAEFSMDGFHQRPTVA